MTTNLMWTTAVRCCLRARRSLQCSPRLPLSNRVVRFLSTFTPTNKTQQTFDVLIAGGGVVGSALAKVLHQRMPLLSVGLLEAGSGPAAAASTTSSSTTTSASNSIPNPRCYALSPKSLQLLGIMPNDKDKASSSTAAAAPSQASGALVGVEAAYYESMQVWEQDSPSLVVFDASTDLAGTEFPNDGCSCLGAIVEDAPLVAALWDKLQGEKDDESESSSSSSSSSVPVVLMPNTRVSNLVVNKDKTDSLVHVETSTTRTSMADNASATPRTTYSTKLLVAADGANSWVRNNSKVCSSDDKSMEWQGLEYNRTALTCTVKLAARQGRSSSSMEPSRAFQRFFKNGDGPLALLPTRRPAEYATIVWSTTNEQAMEFKTSNDKTRQRLVQKLNSLLQQGPQRLPPLFEHENAACDSLFGNLAYGMERLVDTVQYGLTMAHWNDHDQVFTSPPTIEDIASPVYAFPLSCKHASSYIAAQGRIVLVGDAAHTVHPMAGQGLNIGLDDVAALVDSVERSYRAGMELHTFLEGAYNQTQRFKNAMRQQGIHGLHQLFVTGDKNGSGYSTSNVLLQHGKSLGMHVVNHVGPIKRQLAAVAAGAGVL